MKSKIGFLMGCIIFLFVLSCSRAPVTEVTENFEGGSFNASLFTGGGGDGSLGQIVSDPKMVISGKYSAYSKADPAKNMWWEFLYSNRKKIPLEKNATYNVTFSYKVIESLGDNGFYYFLARTKTGGFSHDKGINKWSDSLGTVRTKSLNFTLDNFDDYFLIWGIHGKGALSIDDIKIKKIK